ncbi:MAG: MOSC domain-containing protein [Anaerolineae bacterium]|nr:MOSC domain-containing protein [Anaerolineae bacterium]
MIHLSTSELEAGLETIYQSPKDEGVLRMIVARPRPLERQRLDEGQLDLTVGLVGDNWHTRPSSRTPDGSPHPEMQLNLMNARVITLLAQSQERWPLAGDQLFVDLDLSQDNLPPGTRLAVGAAAIIEVTTIPHTGCQKFRERFGLNALKFVSTPLGKQLNLRGINAKVIQPGTIRPGDVVKKI